MNAFNRVLIVKPSSLGDIVHTLPVAHALKRHHPEWTLGWMVAAPFASLVAADPCVDRIHRIDIPSTSEPGAGKLAWLRAGQAMVHAWRSLRRQWRQQPYDLILDLHGSLRGALLGRANPGGFRVGFADARELNPLFQNELIRVAPSTVHALDKNLLFCDFLDAPVRDEDFFLHCPDEAVRTVDGFLAEYGVEKGEVLIYGNPAARWASKFWPVSHWVELGDRLANRGMRLVLGGGPGDRDVLEEIGGSMDRSPLITAGRLDLIQSAALLQRCRCYVGLDSGPMHMAALSGVPVVALFGPTHPQRVGPWGVAHRILRARDLDCLECRRRHCQSMACMHNISAGDVEESLMDLLDETASLKSDS